MRLHNWVIEEVDGGYMGWADFWRCKDCGASGGPALEGRSPPVFKPFYAGTGMELGDDCITSKKMIEAYEMGFDACLKRVPPKIQKKFSIKR